MSRRAALVGALACLAAPLAAHAQDAGKAPYPAMAPLDQYAETSETAEVALARTAAPASISGRAEIRVLTRQGYVTAAAGENGFVCLVERAWNTDFDDPEFFNPKVRAPNCYNAAAARSVLPAYLKRSEWVLGGLSRAEVKARLQAAVVARTITEPAVGAMSFMMSKRGYLGDAVGHAHPHLMFYLPRSEAAAWGADLAGSPVTAAQGGPEPLTIFFVPASKWSDGDSATSHP
ncbi:MAG: hypothetical protein JF588_04395 [Caulobacterales bacterium]|nr:hypothetical protein [Caulobacterales bacterium]